MVYYSMEKTFEVFISDSYTEEGLERYIIKAKNKVEAIRKGKEMFGLDNFKRNKNLDIYVEKTNSSDSMGGVF